MNYDPREIATLVRDALLMKQHAEAAQPETLIDELEAEADASLRAIQSMIDAMARQRRLWLANGMNALIADPTAAIPGTFSRARWAEIKETFDRFGQWLETPQPGTGTPPLVVVSRRGNPPEPAPAPVEPVEPPDVVIVEDGPQAIVGEVEDVLIDGKTTKAANRGKK
jgi:hypothetical protein